MFECKVGLNNGLLSLIQMEESHFGELYLVASNSIVWEHYPESDRKTGERNYF